MPDSQLRVIKVDAAAPLSEELRAHAAFIVSLGCDRSTAGKALGLPPIEWERILADDAALAAELDMAEARAEVHHMTCVHKAAEDAKNFRGSIWWLERMRPEVYHRRDARGLTEDDLEQLTELIGDEVSDEAARQRVIERLRAFSRT